MADQSLTSPVGGLSALFVCLACDEAVNYNT
jgi:hypothetical protein